MQLVDHALRVGEARGFHAVLAPLAAAPVLPVLHHGVQRRFHCTVAGGDAEQFVLRLVTLLGLPQAPSPARHHRRAASQFAVTAHHVVEFRSVDEVIINPASRFRTNDQRMRSGGNADVDIGHRSVIPQDAKTGGRYQHRYGHVAIGLLQVHAVAVVVEQAV